MTVSSASWWAARFRRIVLGYGDVTGKEKLESAVEELMRAVRYDEAACCHRDALASWRNPRETRTPFDVLAERCRMHRSGK